MSEPEEDPTTREPWLDERQRILLLAVGVQGGLIVLAGRWAG